MEEISIEVSEMVNIVPIKNYYKSHLLDFFRTMIYYKDGHIKTNQARILAKLQDSKKKNIYYRYDKTDKAVRGNSEDHDDREDNTEGLSPERLSKLIGEWKAKNRHLE